jgi:hypothetical protein
LENEIGFRQHGSQANGLQTEIATPAFGGLAMTEELPS